MQEKLLSMEHMTAVLDNAPVAIYVSATDSMELLYANQQAKDLFLQHPDTEGLTCYQAAGLDKPCFFCRADSMSETELLVREFQHPHSGRTYQLNGKTIDWNGRSAHIEYILDITEKKLEEDRSKVLKEMLEATFSNIPCGLSVYEFDGEKISPVFHNPIFYQIMGYSEEHIRKMEQETDFLGVHPEDRKHLMDTIWETIKENGVLRETYRVYNDRAGEYRWIRLEGSVKLDEDGKKLLYGIYSDVSGQVQLEQELASANENLKESQSKLDHLVNSIPGGIASYEIIDGRFVPTFYSDGVMKLSGHTREEYDQLVKDDALGVIYGPDRERIHGLVKAAIAGGEVLDVSYRMRHKNGKLIWIHLNGRRMGPLAEITKFYAVFTGMSEETHLYESIANATVDGIYVIDRNNYDLFYANESENLFMKEADCIGRKCYEALHGKSSPCEFCTLNNHEPDGEEHSMAMEGGNRFYNTRFRETIWNGIPAYVKYVRDVTEEVKARKEKERLEQYFQTVLKNIPGGIGVIQHEKDGSMTPEFLSDGFAALTDMSLEEAWKLYREDAMSGVHPDDKDRVNQEMAAYMASGDSHCEIIYRLKKGLSGYAWVKNTLSLIQNEGGESRVYAVYHDITKEMEEQKLLRKQYKDLIMQHYNTSDPNVLIMGHCNVTQNRILEIIDRTDSDLLENLGYVREEFFNGIAEFIVDEKEQQEFRNTYLNLPAIAAFKKNDTERILKCFIKLPKEALGRFVQFKVNLVETPDTGDVTGILTVTDITEQTISDRILHQLSVTSYDFVIDLDLDQDTYTVLTSSAECEPMEPVGSHAGRIAYMLESAVLPKDKEQYINALEPKAMLSRLEKEGAYTFSYSILNEKGDIRTKNMTVSPIDLRIGRICLVRSDITDSVREQQGLFNMMAYTFELMGFIDIRSNRFTMYTRQIVLENLSPFMVDNYDVSIERFADYYGSPEEKEEVKKQFRLKTMLRRLQEKSTGYDFVFPYQSEKGACYKQINVLWGDENHRTICLVRADVTDMLATERKAKKALEDALALAREANQAKSDFLSAMSHDIRTPMNAIMGMTTLAVAHLDEKERVADYLQKISISSKHLLSLINDILDMSKIEQAKITLNRAKISLSELLEQLFAIMAPQAKASGILFQIRKEKISNQYFYGDFLRMNQILINILSNAIKFTKNGGCVDFLVEEMPPTQKAGWVRYGFTITDTGMGMPEEFFAHIFEPFSRSSSSERIEGTGLGLSITKGLIDLMGGTITVESKVGVGTTFRVELECEIWMGDGTDQREKEGKRSEVPEEKLFAGRCFLVAEDNAINAEILSELLQMRGATAIVKSDGAEAVQAFQRAEPEAYDAILMDIRMPQMDGYEATRLIRGMEREDAKSIPIIAMTANAFAEDIQMAMEAGMTAHIAKPIDMDILWDTLSRILK